jgi:flagellar capping protein FliD
MKKIAKISVINAFFNNNITLEILKIGGITDKKVAVLSKRVNSENIKATYIDDVHKALKTITEALENWDETRKLVSVELWNYYNLMKFDNFEMQQQKIAVKMLKDSWKAMPRYRKDEHVKK